MGSLKEDAVLVGRAKRATKGIVDGFTWWHESGASSGALTAILDAVTSGREITDDEYMALLTPDEPASDEPNES